MSSQLVVAANFTAEPIAETIQFWMRELDWPQEELRFAPFDQVFQTLLDPNGLFARNEASGANVLLIKTDEWSEDDGLELLEYLEQHRFAAPVILIWCPPGEAPGLATKATGIEVMSSEEILAAYPVERVFDAVAERAGRVPYTREAFTAIGTALMRRLHAMRQTPVKVIAVDADNTLWRGVCGEDGPLGVTVSPEHEALQRRLLEQREQGKLLAVVSKNNEADVWETFEQNPGMVIRREEITAARINWEPKSASIEDLAAELNLGIDSFVMVDDDRRECAEVASGAPGIRVLWLGGGAPLDELLRHYWPLDQLKVTEEDRKRQQFYSEAAERARFESRAKTFGEFLDGLELEVRFEGIGRENLERVSQLTMRTNQMNASTVRRAESEIEAWLADGDREGWAVHVRDRFGDYGLVGVMLAEHGSDATRVDTFLLSCRALGRGVEHCMLRRVAESSARRGVSMMTIDLMETARNAPAREFIASLPAGGRVEDLQQLEYRPVTKPQPVPEEKKRSTAGVTSRADYARIARELRTVSAIRAAMLRGRGPAQLPEGTELEVRVAAIWAELLHLDMLTLDDDFFDLGGHSLLAVQLLARLHEEFGVELPQSAVYDGQLTVRELARAIELEQLGAGGLSAADYEALLDEIDQLSDEEVRALLERESGGR